jgi:hypothetical protein
MGWSQPRAGGQAVGVARSSDADQTVLVNMPQVNMPQVKMAHVKVAHVKVAHVKVAHVKVAHVKVAGATMSEINMFG